MAVSADATAGCWSYVHPTSVLVSIPLLHKGRAFADPFMCCTGRRKFGVFFLLWVKVSLFCGVGFFFLSFILFDFFFSTRAQHVERD